MNPSTNRCGSCGKDLGPGGGNRVFSGGEMIAVRCSACMNAAMERASRAMAVPRASPPIPPRLRLVE